MPEGKLFTGITRLKKIRERYEVFDGMADTWIIETYNDHILGIGRYYKGEKLLALFNFSEHEQVAWISEDEEYIDLRSNQKIDAHNVKVDGHGYLWLYHKFDEGE